MKIHFFSPINDPSWILQPRFHFLLKSESFCYTLYDFLAFYFWGGFVFFISKPSFFLIFICLVCFVLKQCDSSDDDTLGVPQGFYNPLDEPSPLGLRLRKSPSLLDLIQMRLSQQHESRKGDQKGSGGGAAADSKLKASNFPGTVLKIGTWEVCL